MLSTSPAGACADARVVATARTSSARINTFMTTSVDEARRWNGCTAHRAQPVDYRQVRARGGGARGPAKHAFTAPPSHSWSYVRAEDTRFGEPLFGIPGKRLRSGLRFRTADRAHNPFTGQRIAEVGRSAYIGVELGF